MAEFHVNQRWCKGVNVTCTRVKGRRASARLSLSLPALNTGDGSVWKIISSKDASNISRSTCY